MLYDFIDYFANAYMGAEPATEFMQGIFMLIGIAFAVLPSVVMFVGMLYIFKFRMVFGTLLAPAFVMGLFLGIAISIYPIQFNQQFKECVPVTVKVEYRGTVLEQTGVECHSRTSLTAEWGAWQFNGLQPAVTQ